MRRGWGEKTHQEHNISSLLEDRRGKKPKISDREFYIRATKG